MKTSIAFIALAISTSLYAKEYGTFKKTSGPDICPEGFMRMIEIEKDEKVLIFGASHSWPLKSGKSGEIVERSEELGCEFITKYTMDSESVVFDMKTDKCKESRLNSKSKSMFKFTKNGLVLDHETDLKTEKHKKYKCIYSRSLKDD